MSNLAALQHLMNIKWSGKWVTEPSWSREVVTRKDLSTGDYIIYSGMAYPPEVMDPNDWWYKYTHKFKFLLQSVTEGNCELMEQEIQYLLRNEFYPAPWFPTWNRDETNTLCLLELDEGTGNPLDSTDNNYDFTLDGSYPPTWKTDGGIHGTNYLRFEGDTNRDIMSNGTLLDDLSSITALSFELICRPIAGYWAAAGSSDVFNKVNVADPREEIKLTLHTTGDQLRFEQSVNDDADGVLGASLAESRWSSILATVGPRGMELYLNGILIQSDITLTELMGDGTAASFLIQGAAQAAADLDIQRFRVSSEQRFPYDSLIITGSKDASKPSSNLYQREITVTGILTNVFLGGNR